MLTDVVAVIAITQLPLAATDMMKAAASFSTPAATCAAVDAARFLSACLTFTFEFC